MNDAVLKLSNMGEYADVIDSEQQWGIVVLEMPSLFGSNVKEVPSREWPDEHGVDVYDANEAYLAAFDVEIKIGVVTKVDEYGRMETDINKSISDFIHWFTTDGVLKKLYCPHTLQGRQNVRFKGLVPDDCVRKNGYYTMVMKLTVEIGDPITLVRLW